MQKEHKFEILARENGTLITSFEVTDNLRLEVPTPKGNLIISYTKYKDEKENDNIQS